WTCSSWALKLTLALMLAGFDARQHYIRPSRRRPLPQQQPAPSPSLNSRLLLMDLSPTPQASGIPSAPLRPPAARSTACCHRETPVCGSRLICCALSALGPYSAQLPWLRRSPPFVSPTLSRARTRLSSHQC